MFFQMASRACMRKAQYDFAGRYFCTLPKELQLLSKRGFAENAVVFDLKPIAVGDTGLNYRAGRLDGLDGKITPFPEAHKRATGLFLVKIQPPLGKKQCSL